MMDVSDIEMLEVIVTQGSVSRAAEVLHITQSTLSKRLSRLEEKLGIALFFRHAGGLTATEATHYLIEEGESLKGRLTSMVRHVELMAELKVGELNLGVGPIVEQLFFPEILLGVSEFSRRLSVSLCTDKPEKLLQKLRDGTVDLIVGPFDREAVEDDLYYEEIHQEPNVAVARSNHPLVQALQDFAPDEQLRLSELLSRHQTPSILPNISATMEAQFPEGYYQPTIRCENFDIAKQLVARSDYVTAGPASLFRTELAEASLVQLPIAIPVVWTAAMVALPENQLSPLIRAVMQLFRDQAKQLH